MTTSPTARKLLQKLAPLLITPSQSSETQQTIASWIIFNRKKKDALAEGMNIALRDSTNESNCADRLMVLLKIVHRVLVTNCPTTGDSSSADVTIWEKSEALRQTLVEGVVLTLLTELGVCLSHDSANKKQVEDMIHMWEQNSVCGTGSFDWGGVRQKWEDGLTKKGSSDIDAPGEDASSPSVAVEMDLVDTTVIKEKENPSDTNELSSERNEEASVLSVDKVVPCTPDKEEKEPSSPDERRKLFTKQDSTMSTTSIATVQEIDYEGVEEAHVEPHRFLDAAKVIAQLQITRDIGGDTAMNLSSVFGQIPSEVEEICRIMKEQDEKEENTQKEYVEILSKLNDDFLDLDLKYVKQSLQTYKEAIRQQKRARMQCLHLLLQSRCSFGSMEAAQILFDKQKCGNADDNDQDIPNIDDIVNKLKKRKEALSDALALEGLDVEEDAEEEKKLEKEEKGIVPFSWLMEKVGNEATESTQISADGSDDDPVVKKPKHA